MSSAKIGSPGLRRRGNPFIAKSPTKASPVSSSTPSEPRTPSGYASILTGIKQLIADSRHRALAAVNRELVCLYWQIGGTIVQQQETAHWGDAVVEQLAADLRAEFPDMSGLSAFNLWRTRKFYVSCRETDQWL